MVELFWQAEKPFPFDLKLHVRMIVKDLKEKRNVLYNTFDLQKVHSELFGD